MKKNTTLWIVATLIITILSSCLGNKDGNISEARDCSITAFSLKDFDTKYTTKDKDGQDSTYTVKIHAHEYTFTINQLQREIYNVDSLPAGANITKILCNITSDGNVVYRDNKYDPSNPSSIEWRNTNDSIDFSKPVTMRVWAYNGVDYRDYMVRLNVHKQNADSTLWVKDWFPGEDLQEMHAVTFGNLVAVFGMGADGLMVTTATNGESDWSKPTTVKGLTASADYTAAASLYGLLYITQDNTLYCSTDGVNWAPAEANTAITSLMGSNSTQLFACHEDQFLVSEDGQSWSPEPTEYADRVPTARISYASVPLNTISIYERTILTGIQPLSTDSVADVWYRQGTDPWALMHTSWKETYRLPNLQNLTMLQFKDALIAFGGPVLNAHCPGVALDHLYVSLDNGLTWKTQADDRLNIYPKLPAALKGYEEDFTAYVDQEDNIWILCSNGEVWKGKMVKETVLTPKED